MPRGSFARCIATLVALAVVVAPSGFVYLSASHGGSAAATSARPANSAILAPSLLPSSLSLGSGWDGIDYRATGGCATCILPDVSVASGNGYVVEVAGSLLRVWTTSGTQLLNETLNTFANVPAGDHLVDAQVVYDPLSQRWFVSLLDSTSVMIYYAGSLTSDPSQTGNTHWNIQHFATPKAGLTFDQPRLSVDGNEVVIVDNLRNGSALPAGFDVTAANKSQLITGGPLQTCTTGEVGGSADASYIPASDLSSSNTTYLVSDNAANISWINVRTLIGPASSCRLSAAASPATNATAPPNATEPGTASLLHTSGNITGATWRNGTLWVAATNACTPTGDTQLRSCLHLWKIATSSDSIVQDFNWSRGAGYYEYYPSVATDAAGDLIVVYGESSASFSEYPSIYAATQAPADPPGSLETPHLLKAGTGPYNPASGCSGTPKVCPYGQWFSATIDPLTSSGIWVAGEYTASDSTSDLWHSWINEVSSSVGSTWIAGTVSPTTAQVMIDGATIPLFAGKFNVTVSAGTHSVEASLAGYQSFSTDVTLGAGQGIHLTVDLVPGSSSTAAGQGLYEPVPLWSVLALLAVLVTILIVVVAVRRRRKEPPRAWQEEQAGVGTAGLASAIASALDKRTSGSRDERDRRRGRGGLPPYSEHEEGGGYSGN